MNYFAFFDIPLAFNIDLDLLKKVYYANSKKFHPDFHAQADATTQQWAMEQSTLNNQAYTTLADEDQRIKHILEIKGVLAPDTAIPPLPPDFLMEMMDINEAIMDLQMDFEATKYQNTLKSVESIENQILAEAKPILENYSEEVGSQADLEIIKNFWLKKKYLLRIKENLSIFASAF